MLRKRSSQQQTRRPHEAELKQLDAGKQLLLRKLCWSMSLRLHHDLAWFRQMDVRSIHGSTACTEAGVSEVQYHNALSRR